MMLKILAVSTLLVSSTLGFAEEVTREGAEALMVDCQAERQENIAPLRDQAIEDCVNDRRIDRESCERRNANFGERIQGGTRPGLFWWLPVCEKAVEAERYFRRNPRSNVYTFG